jgi:hypothetical protein
MLIAQCCCLRACLRPVDEPLEKPFTRIRANLAPTSNRQQQTAGNERGREGAGHAEHRNAAQLRQAAGSELQGDLQ